MPRSAAVNQAVLSMVAATMVWGGTFVVTRAALPHLAVATLVLARFGVAALVLVLAALLGRRRFDRTTWLAGLACAPFIFACYALQAYGLRDTSAGSSAFLTCAGTLAAPFIAWGMLRQRPSPAIFLGMGLALAGSALLSWRTGLGFGRAEQITLVGAVAYAVQIVIVARVAPQVDPIALTGVQSLGVSLIALPLASPGAALAALTAGNGVGWRVGYLALGGTVLAPLLQVHSQRTLPASRVALLFALEPVFALLIAVTAGGERFLPRWWLGATLILCAVLVAEWRGQPDS